MFAIFLLILPIYSQTPDEIFTGEWDVHAGSESDHELAIKYSFEFHENKTSGRTISTVWHSNIVSTKDPEYKSIKPMIAQFEISFEDYTKDSDDFEGTIYYGDHSIDFELKSLENERYSTKINLDFQKIYVSLEIIKNKIMEISIGSLGNEENQAVEANLVAYRAQPIKLVQIHPMFKKGFNDERSSSRDSYPEYTLPKNGATFSDYVKYYKSKGIRYFYLHKTQIYTVVFILVVQLIFFTLVGFIQRTCSKGKKQQIAKTKEADDQKNENNTNDDTNEEEGKNDDENNEEEENDNKDSE